MPKETLDGVLTVKIPHRWLEILDAMGDPEEKDRGRVVRRILREALIATGQLRPDDDRPKAPRPKSGERKRFS